MKKNNIAFITILFLLFTSCSNKTTQIGEDTFVQESKVYRIINNQVTEIGDLNNVDIPKSNMLESKLKSLGTNDLKYVKKGASAELKGVYRGDTFFFKLTINGINDLRENYTINGSFTINFLDEYYFRLYETEIQSSNIVGIVNDYGEIIHFEYNGKIQMSYEIYLAIKDYSVQSSFRRI